MKGRLTIAGLSLIIISLCVPSLGLLVMKALGNVDRRQELIGKLTFFNTLNRQKETFVAPNAPKVSFYSCGPTVYDYAHIGNFRAFLTYDVLKRWLEYSGYEVDHVCNLTDVDDKIIVKMNTEGKTLKEVTEKYTNAFFEDLKTLNIKPARLYPKATDHIKDIEEMISKLMEKGHAYEENGSVYFRVKSFKPYGRLANLKFDEMKDGAGAYGPNERRGSEEKENSRDFALWKAFNPLDGEVVWNTNWGNGRPGWHIECSAMCNCILGPTIDIHAGGVDLVFPHHENELAQSEAYSNKLFCRYWIHNGFVNIDNEKMSKSLKNFMTLRDIAKSPFDARAFRFMVVSAQYRNPLNFTPETFNAACSSLKRIDKLIAQLKAIISGSKSDSDNDKNENHDNSSSDAAKVSEEDLVAAAETALTSFEAAMCDDMNTPRGSASLFGLVKQAEKAIYKSKTLTVAGASAVLDAIMCMDTVFGVCYDVPTDSFQASITAGATTTTTITTQSSEDKSSATQSNAPQNVIELAQKRAEMKKNKQYKEADSLRGEILKLGFEVKDTKEGGFQLVPI